MGLSLVLRQPLFIAEANLRNLEKRKREEKNIFEKSSKTGFCVTVV
jgi:hypothetical protein